ncbi:hypothetical protein BaRGS_00007804 [Batillaria attramentaria]|uniref:Uncharacterized protein n=1 Tax=Batillaria attramentaria TaxID=370345 RepID=A0ABD0LN97_9CAEN
MVQIVTIAHNIRWISQYAKSCNTQQKKKKTLLQASTRSISPKQLKMPLHRLHVIRGTYVAAANANTRPAGKMSDTSSSHQTFVTPFR